ELYGTKYTKGEYAKVAEALGSYSEKVENPAQVVPAIQRGVTAVESGLPAVLEVITSEEPDMPYRAF
ncbi:MAG: hypothetical protein QGH54_17410, partial [SAR202 cluster bacterium]|nr:hypothetical protein [SAR202 cluster bacterium]